jgi:FkbM family methyltransferase
MSIEGRQKRLVMTRYGHQMQVLEEDFIGDAIIRDGIFDITGVELLHSVLLSMQQQQPVVLDIGANIGNHAVAISPYCTQLYCFEIQPQLATLLQDNLRLNQIKQAQVFAFGLSDQDRTLPVYIDNAGNLGRSTVEQGIQLIKHTEKRAKVRRGDDVLAEHLVSKVDLIKIDIEGHEIMALLGLQQTIVKHRPIIVMEWNNDVTRAYFRKFNCQATLFAGYKMIGVVNRLHRLFWQGKLMRGLRRSFFKRTDKNPWQPILVDFNFDSDYSHILIFPVEKAYLLEGLPRHH